MKSLTKLFLLMFLLTPLAAKADPYICLLLTTDQTFDVEGWPDQNKPLSPFATYNGVEYAILQDREVNPRFVTFSITNIALKEAHNSLGVTAITMPGGMFTYMNGLPGDPGSVDISCFRKDPATKPTGASANSTSQGTAPEVTATAANSGLTADQALQVAKLVAAAQLQMAQKQIAQALGATQDQIQQLALKAKSYLPELQKNWRSYWSGHSAKPSDQPTDVPKTNDAGAIRP